MKPKHMCYAAFLFLILASSMVGIEPQAFAVEPLRAGTIQQQSAQSGSCGANLTWELNDSGVLTISGTGPMANYGGDYYAYEPDKYDGAHPGWYDFSDEISEVRINEGVTSVGGSAFAHCGEIIKVSLPSTLTAIGDRAF